MHEPNSTACTLHLSLKNPITHSEVDRLIQSIIQTQDQSYLLIDFGQHEFTSIAVLRYCKEEFSRISHKLESFDKIAFVSAPPYRGIDQDQLRYFHKKRRAVEWFQTGRDS